MEYEISISEHQSIRLERHPESNIVSITIGRWPAYTHISIGQRVARQLAYALTVAGFDPQQDTVTEPGT
jgi:hypothetical protein